MRAYHAYMWISPDDILQEMDKPLLLSIEYLTLGVSRFFASYGKHLEI